MIFLDSSVVLAYLLDEHRAPPASLWEQRTVASRLLEYEVWTRLNARGLARTHGEAAAALIRRTSFVELSPFVLARALQPFPVAVRTLDALHLATAEFLRARGRDVELASYDERLLTGARALGIRLTAL